MQQVQVDIEQARTIWQIRHVMAFPQLVIEGKSVHEALPVGSPVARLATARSEPTIGARTLDTFTDEQLRHAVRLLTFIINNSFSSQSHCARCSLDAVTLSPVPVPQG